MSDKGEAFAMESKPTIKKQRHHLGVQYFHIDSVKKLNKNGAIKKAT